MKTIIISENKLYLLNETGDLTPNKNGTVDFSIDPIRFGTNTTKDSENQFADTRFFGTRNDILRGDNTVDVGSLQDNYRRKLAAINLYKAALSIIRGRANAKELNRDEFKYAETTSYNTALKYIREKNISATIAAIDRATTEFNMIKNSINFLF